MSLRTWMVRKVKNIDYKKMNNIVNIIHENTGKSKLYIKYDIFRNFIKRGTGYTDYFRGDYINLTEKEKDTFINTKSFFKLLAYLNDERYKIILKDKLVFNMVFKKYLKRDYINLNISSFEEFKDFVKDKDVVFAKKPLGEGGHGVSKVDIKTCKDLKSVYNNLIKNGQILVEEAIKQSKELNEINPNVVNSFRIITLYKDGKVYILNNALRINQDTTDVIGCTNDLYCSLNEDGLIDSNVIDDYGNIYTEHPLTKKVFKDVKIKGVDTAFNMCKEAAKLIPQYRYIGWDVAFSEKGPVLVEGNEWPGYGLIQFYKLKNKKTGHLKEVSDILKEEMKNINL